MAARIERKILVKTSSDSLAHIDKQVFICQIETMSHICGKLGNGSKLIGIVIVAHGGLAREYLAALEHVVGHMDGIIAVAINAECVRAEKQAEINDAVCEVDDGSGVIVVTDMFGGTPSNLAVAACKANNRKVVYGTNLPLLVKLSKARHMNINDAVSKALDAGHKYLDCTSKRLV